MVPWGRLAAWAAHHATGQTRHDDQTGFCKTCGQTVGHARAQGGGIARAHNCHAGTRELLVLSQNPKEGRGVGDFSQQARIAGFMLKNEIRANFLAGEIFALRHMLATQLIRFDPLAAGQVGQGSQGFGSRAMGGHQPPVGGRPDARGAQQLQPRDAIIFAHAGLG